MTINYTDVWTAPFSRLLFGHTVIPWNRPQCKHCHYTIN